MVFEKTQPSGDASSGAQRRMVILDDDPAILKTVGLLARRIGFQTKTCSTLAELEEALVSFVPEVLLIDLMMPDIDGIDVVNRIGPLSKTALIIMSGADSRTYEATRKVLESGGTKIAGFLSKPFGSRELAQTLSALSVAPAPPCERLNTRAPREILSPEEFQEAVLSGRIEPFYQPIFLSDGKTLKGFEALARVEGEQVNCFPREYLDQLVADTNLSAKLTDIVIARSLRFMKDLAGHDDLTISINIFGAHAAADGFRHWLVGQCTRNGIARNRVILELSEATLCSLEEDGLRKITQLRLAGFGLSIDDFGTGHSSLGRLVGLPFSEVKIDKAFCLALTHSQPATAVIEACISLAARLDLKVTAEGVETEEIAALLASMGCDALQGHLFGQAMPGQMVTRWLTENHLRYR